MSARYLTLDAWLINAISIITSNKAEVIQLMQI